jgi:hypothetical protein
MAEWRMSLVGRGCEDGVGDWRDLVACGCIWLRCTGGFGWGRRGGGRVGRDGLAGAPGRVGLSGYTGTPFGSTEIYTDEVEWWFEGNAPCGSQIVEGAWACAADVSAPRV